MSGDAQFIDTNILIYAHDASAGEKHEVASSLVKSLWESRQGCLSVQVLQEFYVAVTCKVRVPLPEDMAMRIVTEYGNWPVHCPGTADIVRAIGIHMRYGISFWDALIIQSAGRLGCATVWSEDLNAGQLYEDVTVKNPFTR